MSLLVCDRDFFEGAVIGSYDRLIEDHKSNVKISYENVDSVIFKWNCKQLIQIINLVHEQGGVELHSGNRIFVIAPNPKLTRDSYPWRCTYYIESCGPTMDELFETVEDSLISVFLSYPESKISHFKLDTWHDEFTKINDNFSFNITH